MEIKTDYEFIEEMKLFSEPFFPDRQENREKYSIQFDFPDNEALLVSACESLKRYCNAAGHTLSDEGYKIRICCKKTSVYEEYGLEFIPGSCTVYAADPEGIRRGIYEFIDELCANGGSFIKSEKSISRKPWVTDRISRCPFSPIKRPPINTDELLDDIDYYPDGYLDTLAHNGINGIWLVTTINELGISFCTPEDTQRQKRLAKLASMAAKCRRYGVKVWLFTIEPFSVTDDAEIYKKHPEMFIKGPAMWGRRCYCPNSPDTQRYLHEIFSSTFAAVPDLAGVISIVLGERPTTCLSTLDVLSEQRVYCQDQCKLSHGMIMNKNLSAISKGIKQGAPSAKLIAWYYIPAAAKNAEWIETLSAATPDDVVAMFNFESGGEAVQLGKKHYSGDYWISYEGPSERFEKAATSRKGKLSGAKLQLGSGHELVTVPYIPVPGIAYNKYRSLNALGVSSVMQSWYIGNFPGLMTDACGKLAFEDFSGGAESFLCRLAAPFWGKSTDQMIQAWQIFTEAYKKMPFSLLFQYYGPQNAFMLWRYHFLPDLEPLAPPWKPNFKFGGDIIGEALPFFELDDAAQLLKEMADGWQKGMDILLPLKEKFADSRVNIRDINIAEIIGLMLKGSANLLEFFRMRRRLYSENLTKDEYIKLIDEMISSLHLHKELCEKTIPLMEYDSRLGYHGESLMRIFDPENTREALNDIAGSLECANVLRRAVLNGQTPFEYAKSVFSEKVSPDTVYQTETYKWSYTVENDRFILTLSDYSGDDLWFQGYFVDYTGCCFPLQDRVTIKNGVLNNIGNIRRHFTGYPDDSGFEAKYGKNNELILSWPLSSIPGATNEKRIRFNCSFGPFAKQVYAFGKGYVSRLHQEQHMPSDSVLIEL